MQLTREQWLTIAIEHLREHFKTCGYTIPEKVRVSCGLPSSRAFTTKRAIGEAWCSSNSKDHAFEIFISPTVDDPHTVLACLVHELVHVTVGLKCGHKGAFQRAASLVGLVGPWTSTTASDTLANYLAVVRAAIGEYPHKALTKMTNGKKKQSTRLIKAYCEHCFYTVRVTMKWILTAAPICPCEECDNFQGRMDIDIDPADAELTTE